MRKNFFSKLTLFFQNDIISYVNLCFIYAGGENCRAYYGGDFLLKNFKSLFKYVGEYKKNAILSPILVLFEVIMECMIPAIAGELITFIEASNGVEGASLERIKITGWLIDLIGKEHVTAVILVFCSILICFALLSPVFQSGQTDIGIRWRGSYPYRCKDGIDGGRDVLGLEADGCTE